LPKDKDKEAGKMVATEPVPVPVRVISWGLPGALSAMETVADSAPISEGLKVTLIVQVLLGVTVAPVQVSALLTKSLAFVPVTETLREVKLAFPVLVRVTLWAALVVPSA
jgi:hypothetical protein